MSEDGQRAPGSFYYYAPNQGAPVFFAVAFAASGIFHTWQCIHYKCSNVVSLHPIVCLTFAIGFAMREYGAFQDDNLGAFIGSTVLIYASPPLLELANYHVLGRITAYIPYCAPMPPNRVLATFGILSMLVESLSGIGVPWIANSQATEQLQKAGHALVKASLLLQIVVVSASIPLAVVFQRRCAQMESPEHARRIKGPLTTIYLSTALILVRCIYRTVEYFIVSGNADDDNASIIQRYECFFYIFEATLMLSNEIWWNVRYPMRDLPRSKVIYLARDGMSEAKRESPRRGGGGFVG
ncbi:hypothetical protein LTR08_003646 [Meristemomyces frigidus]|nr:hypothetical protein LTR08_003646 [Meristemomyces frigidus]